MHTERVKSRRLVHLPVCPCSAAVQPRSHTCGGGSSCRLCSGGRAWPCFPPGTPRAWPSYLTHHKHCRKGFSSVASSNWRLYEVNIRGFTQNGPGKKKHGSGLYFFATSRGGTRLSSVRCLSPGDHVTLRPLQR